MQEFDIAIIGAGPGGYVGAIRARQLGAKVCLMEKDKLGGTCLNRGCIPAKALYFSAKTLSAVKKAAPFGVNTGSVNFDLAKAVDRKDDVVKRLVGGVEQLLKGNGVEVFYGAGSIEGAGRGRGARKDGSTELISAKKKKIRTGKEPAPIPS